MTIKQHPEDHPCRNSIYDNDIIGHGWGSLVDTTLAIVHLECFLEGRQIPTDGSDLMHPNDNPPGCLIVTERSKNRWHTNLYGNTSWWSMVERTGRPFALFVGYSPFEEARDFPSKEIVRKWIGETTLGMGIVFAELYN